jgi:CRP-like cAMP-binding protein
MLRPLPATHNLLLAALPAADYHALLPDFEYVKLPLGKCIWEAGAALRHIYFPVEGIVSLLYVTEAGASAELAIVGCEGMVGISVLLGADTAPSRALVQSACTAYRIPSALLKARFAGAGAIQSLVMRYTQSLIIQISQTAVCNLHHTVEQQLCRWLLLSLDRLPDNRLLMTQELIANMLGVRRQGVTEAARRMEKSGVIQYSRGVITVVNYQALLARACECYLVVKRESGRLLPQPVRFDRPLPPMPRA